MSSMLQRHGPRVELAILAIAALAFVLLMFAGPAFAGADTTFDTALTKFRTSSRAAVARSSPCCRSLAASWRWPRAAFSMGQIAIPVGVGVGAGTGIPIVTSTVTATI